MIAKPEIRKRLAIKQVSAQGGGTASTTLWERLGGRARAEISAQLDLLAGEETLVASFQSGESWCLITTERFVWRQGETVRALPWLQVQGAGPRPGEWAEVARGERRKDTLEDLIVVDGNGDRATLRIERGTGFFLIWSLLADLSAGGSAPVLKQSEAAP
jgi:hypothetical protein